MLQGQIVAGTEADSRLAVLITREPSVPKGTIRTAKNLPKILRKPKVLDAPMLFAPHHRDGRCASAFRAGFAEIYEKAGSESATPLYELCAFALNVYIPNIGQLATARTRLLRVDNTSAATAFIKRGGLVVTTGAGVGGPISERSETREDTMVGDVRKRLFELHRPPPRASVTRPMDGDT